MNVLCQEKYQATKLYVYHVPDNSIIDQFGSLENFTQLILKDAPEVILWLEKIMPTLKGTAKTYADSTDSPPTYVWDCMVKRKEEPKPSKKKNKKK